jgi:hypothetical protein
MMRTRVSGVPTERISLTMDRDALAAARHAAAADGVSLSVWISRATRDRAIARAARASAEEDRRHHDEFVDWDARGADRVFGDAA